MYHSFQKEMFYTMKPNYATFLNGKVEKKPTPLRFGDSLYNVEGLSSAVVQLLLPLSMIAISINVISSGYRSRVEGAGRYGEWLGTRYHWGTNTYMKYIYNLIDRSAVAFKD